MPLLRLIGPNRLRGLSASYIGCSGTKFLRSTADIELGQVALTFQARHEWLILCFSNLDFSRNDKFAGVSLDAVIEIAQEMRFPGRVRANDENQPRTVKLTELR